MTGSTALTVTDLLLDRAGDEAVGLRFEQQSWTWAQYVQTCAEYAAVLRELCGPAAAPHVGVLADNVPAFGFLLGAAALSGTVLVGLNPTRRGAALARDARVSDCQVVLTEGRHLSALAGVDLGVPVIDLDGPHWARLHAAHRGTELTPVPAGAQDLMMLIFTSGTSGDPKAVRCTHAKVAGPGRMLAERFSLGAPDTVYVSMPLFHSNAVMAGWSVGLAAGATVALRRKFSASGFLADVRAFGATYANYVGTPLSYVLATPPLPDDADNPLRIAYGNEGAAADLAAFASRFGCHVVDAFGSTEGGVAIVRTPETPAAALGPLPTGVAIVHPDTGLPCPPAEFDVTGAVANPDSAIGELVNTSGTGAFAGYYNDPDAEAQRLRAGRYHTGDLAYTDAAGYCYFAGRTGDWLRVDGENLGAAPIERVLVRHPAIAEAAVYGIACHVGDAVAAAVVLAPGATLDVAEFADFLAAQPDLGPKQRPRHLRVLDELPRTPTFKVLKRVLAADGLAPTTPIPSRMTRDVR
ncbi:MAG: AMP-binding protein [Mycobacteriaceae bacterium]|nr:AMP-binding protein [Mycobacteriaceae bacterium]